MRGIGAMWGLELVAGNAELAAEKLLRDHKVWVGSAPRMIEIAPPLVFTEAEVAELIAALDCVLAELD